MADSQRYVVVLSLSVLFACPSISYGSPIRSRSLKPILEKRITAAHPSPGTGYFVLATYSFDDGSGQADPQGWTTVDLTAQPDTFFHVADFSSLAAPYAPLEGSKSLWCGTRGIVCTSSHYTNPPGYGNKWDQYFVSIPFSVNGDATVSFMIRYDCEPSYDYGYIEYKTISHRWEGLLTFNGTGETITEATAPAESLGGSAQFRFRFLSDSEYSDEDGGYDSDGALVIDSLTVSDYQGVVDYQDFESEPVGVLATLDGHWGADVAPPFGDYAALVLGDTVLQEDTTYTDTTHIWAFWSGSTQRYECGLKDQLAIPPYRGQNLNDAMNNMAVSPWIDLTPYYGALGSPAAEDTIWLSYDIYYDMPLQFGVIWDWAYRFIIAGDPCPTAWIDRSYIYYYWPHLKWRRDTEFELIPQGAVAVQVGVAAVDNGIYWGSTNCHHHSPLYDNIEAALTIVTPTGTGQQGKPGAFALHQNYPNPFKPTTTISYTIENDCRVILEIFDVAGHRIIELANEYQKAGSRIYRWDGKDSQGNHIASGVYFYRLKAGKQVMTRKMVLLR